jgi:uncharacterized repeat protein (TIGR03837 family)
MTIDILCRVVDNYGDIGFAFRLSRALSELPGDNRIRLVVDDLASFAALCPTVDPSSGFQSVGNPGGAAWLLARWADPGDGALGHFALERPRFALELYACGRPSWYEAILFDDADPDPRLVINIDYLTAEPWAVDFHGLPSLTRNPLVKKYFFMPGFVPGTGGLVLDNSFASLVDAAGEEGSRAAVRRRIGSSRFLRGIPCPVDAFWIVLFSYEHDFTSIVRDIDRFASGRQVFVFVASGRSSRPFLDACANEGNPFAVIPLPLLPQTEWDAFLAASDFSVVRGEESFARACLAGHPFLWQCYPFAPDDGSDRSAGGQIPKVRAFLDLMRPRLSPNGFALYERLTLGFNGVGELSADLPTADVPSGETAPGDFLAVLEAAASGGKDLGYTESFRDFARDIRNLGNLAVNLLTFMRKMG